MDHRIYGAFVLRQIRHYFCRIEFFILLILCGGVWFYLRHIDTRLRRKIVPYAERAAMMRTKRPSLVRRWIENGFLSIKDLGDQKWHYEEGHTAVFAVRGYRPAMEDRFNILIDREKWGMSIYGLFDGHGGEFASDFAERTLLQAIMERVESLPNGNSPNLTKIIIEEFIACDVALVNVTEAASNMAGTTALVAVVHAGMLTVANVGDSRGVMCNQEDKAVPLSVDHKPHDQKEMQRIEAAGGFVAWNGVWRVAGILATSRALGDYFLKRPQNLVIPDPDILTFDLQALRPKFVLLASDGLWDVVENQEAVDRVLVHLNDETGSILDAAEDLVETALQKGSLDNISVMIVRLTEQDYVKSNKQQDKNDVIAATAALTKPAKL